METAAGVGGFPLRLFSGWCLRNAASTCFFQGYSDEVFPSLLGSWLRQMSGEFFLKVGNKDIP